MFSKEKEERKNIKAVALRHFSATTSDAFRKFPFNFISNLKKLHSTENYKNMMTLFHKSMSSYFLPVCMWSSLIKAQHSVKKKDTQKHKKSYIKAHKKYIESTLKLRYEETPRCHNKINQKIISK